MIKFPIFTWHFAFKNAIRFSSYIFSQQKIWQKSKTCDFSPLNKQRTESFCVCVPGISLLHWQELGDILKSKSSSRNMMHLCTWSRQTDKYGSSPTAMHFWDGIKPRVSNRKSYFIDKTLISTKDPEKTGHSIEGSSSRNMARKGIAKISVKYSLATT